MKKLLFAALGGFILLNSVTVLADARLDEWVKKHDMSKYIGSADDNHSKSTLKKSAGKKKEDTAKDTDVIAAVQSESSKSLAPINFIYIGMEAGPSMSQWRDTWDGGGFQDAYSISSVDHRPSLNRQLVLALRFNAGINFLNFYGLEGGFSYYSHFNWDGIVTSTSGTQGDLKVDMSQRSFDILAKYTHHYGDWRAGILLGAAYFENRDTQIQDTTSDPQFYRYKDQNYWTFAYGLEAAYNMPWFRKMDITAKWIGMLGRKDQELSALPNQSPARTIKIKVPMRNTLLFGLTYHIYAMQ